MEIDDLIERLKQEFDEVNPELLKPSLTFRDLESWSSMHALILIALVDTEYGITISGEDLKSIYTVQDLFDFIKNNKTQS